MDLSKELQDALIKRALGYDYDERRMVGGKNGSAEKVEIIHRHMPPDIAAIKRIQFLMTIGEWDQGENSAGSKS